MRTLIIIVIIVLGIAGVWGYRLYEDKSKVLTANSFAECERLKFPVTESFPRLCTAGNKVFTEDIGNIFEKINLINITEPRPNQIVMSPLIVRGEARGSWFFEASFPIALNDGNGNEIARVPAMAKGEWMTADFVPFEAVLTFAPPGTPTGMLRLEKDNPSGLPENADEVRIPIRFNTK